ncbi:MAG: cupin domain-containing protein [Chitinophagaceae bacterium]
MPDNPTPSSHFQQLADIPVRELFPGFHFQLIHTGSNTYSFVTVDAGSTLPIHQHVHEQSSFVLEGKFEMTVGGETTVMEPGSFTLIPANIPHGGTAITDCKLLDIFSPVREDYR